MMMTSCDIGLLLCANFCGASATVAPSTLAKLLTNRDSVIDLLLLSLALVLTIFLFFFMIFSGHYGRSGTVSVKPNVIRTLEIVVPREAGTRII
jgi:hypothetical protein